MVNFLVVTHGDFGSYVIEAAETIVGEQRDGVRSVPVNARMSVEEARAKIVQALAEMDSPDGLVILTDIPGGTPTNLVLPLAKDRKRTTVLTGLNLYMLVTAFSHRRLPFEELAEKMLANARNSIVDVHKLFLSRVKP